ncbi:MAG TPA: heat-inducible transcription repressor HrcA [Dehalococcoidia bacterium]|nr:heat-inducible transcription repressor HrcA [Dehalococcoidia bacterium]
MLSARSEAILKSIVGQYIARAVPVPSQSIINDYELAVSPATIRNEMARLEQEGYIIRPHPSAGSIPSDKGYRYYVETLSDIELPLAEQLLISHQFHQVERELEEWLSLAATLTAQLVQNVAIVTMPKTANCQLKHLELVALRDSLALVVLVLHGARLRQQLITFDQAISQPKLTAMANKLSAAYSGLTRAKISARKLKLSPAEKQVTDCLLKIMQAEDEQEYEHTSLDGLHFTLNQPEFRQGQRGQILMELVDGRSLMRIIAPEGFASSEVQVIIGKENKTAAIQDYSVVISRYGLAGEAAGILSVVGPTRMPYGRTISTVGYLSSVLSQLVAELYGENPS